MNTPAEVKDMQVESFHRASKPWYLTPGLVPRPSLLASECHESCLLCSFVLGRPGKEAMYNPNCYLTCREMLLEWSGVLAT